VSLSRNVLYSVRLAPGITGGGGSVTGNGAGTFSVAGRFHNRRIEYMIDGIPNTVARITRAGVHPSVDAVEEIKVHTTMFDAQYGHSTAAPSTSPRGGTNEVHGIAYLYKRWARSTATPGQQQPRRSEGPVSYRQYGYLFSGRC